MFKPSSGIATRAGAFAFVTAVAVASAWSESPSPPRFQNGRVCWDTLCADPSNKIPTPQVKQQSVTQAPKASKQAADKQVPATSAWTPPSSVPLPPKHISSKTAASGDAFYRYPMIYRADAPPPMPPGASHQPYTQATQGVWYWPGADSIKIPIVAGFDPAIDPSRVMQW
jgi:hypothetical protein